MQLIQAVADDLVDVPTVNVAMMAPLIMAVLEIVTPLVFVKLASLMLDKQG